MFLLASRAFAQDRVILLENPAGAQPGLTSALRIQLTGAADVETRPQVPASGLPERIEAATQLVRSEQALLVVWAEGPVELADGSQEAVLYAVGQREGRAQLEVVRVPGGRGPDMDRTLALKVRAVVDEMRAQHSGLAEPVPSPAQGEAQPAQAPAAPGEAYWTALLAAGVAAAPLARSDFGQWGAVASAGPAWVRGPLRLAATVELGWYPGLDLEHAGASVRYRELDAGLALAAALRVGGVWLGARSGPGIGFVGATGQAASGPMHTRDVRITSWLFGLDAELDLGAGFGFSLGCDVLARFRRQRFTINGDEVADLGRVRPFARALLTWTPASRE